MKNLIGKKVGNYLYVHVSAIDTLTLEQRNFIKMNVPVIFNIVKLNLKLTDVSFIYSPDWDISPEPFIEHSIKYNGNFSKVKFESIENPPIYHGKGFMVKDDYRGFDKQESINKYKSWQSLNLNKNLIGRKKYWENLFLLGE